LTGLPSMALKKLPDTGYLLLYIEHIEHRI
jgi:hypothetical protein